MSKDKLPKIPSFAELGISEDEIEELEREIEKELEEARAKEEGRDPVPVPEGGKVGAGGPAAAKPAPGKDKPPRGKKPGRGKGLRFGGRKRKKAAGAKAERAGVAGDAGVAGSTAPPRAGVGDVGKTASGPRPAGPAPGAKPDPGGKPEPGAKPAAGPSAAPTPPPWNGARGPITLALLLIMAWFSSSFRAIPSPVPASAPESVFSSARAMSHLVRIAAEAHPPGSPAHADVREYLLAQLRALGHEPSVQTTTSTPPGGSFTRAATVRNVLARIPGSQPGGPAVLVTAHYDSREIALGAGDDGSGVVTILETLRALGGPPAAQRPDRPHHRRRGTGAAGCARRSSTSTPGWPTWRWWCPSKCAAVAARR